MTPTQTINAFYQAIIDNNADAIHQSYAPQEEQYSTSGNSPLTTKGFSILLKENTQIAILGIDWLKTPREQIGENLASIGGDIKLFFSTNGKFFEEITRASFILIRIDNTWKIKWEYLFNILTNVASAEEM